MSAIPQARREALRRLLRDEPKPAKRVEAFLVDSAVNVAYLTGFTGDSSQLLITGKGAILLSDGRYQDQIAEECPDLETEIRPIGKTMPDALVEVVQKLGIRRLGFEASSVTVSLQLHLAEKLTGTTLIGLGPKVEALRSIKDATELVEIRKAIDIAERAYAMLRAGLRWEESEKDGADLLEHYLRRCGATSSSFPPIVAAGPRSALPHAKARPDACLGTAESEVLLVDWGASAGRWGYKSDLTRVIAVGKVSPRFESVYRTVLNAQTRAIAMIRPGVSAKDVDAEARRVIEDAGFGPYFTHSLGHGIGLEVHEAPGLRKESEVKLKAGMVVTVEPGVYLPDWGGVRIEDDVLVTEDRAEVLSRTPKDLESARLEFR